MACCGGCAGGGTGSGSGSPVNSPVVLSGVLEDRYDVGSPANPMPIPESIPVQAADVGGADALASSGGFWIVVLFVAIAAYWTDRVKRENE